MAVRIITLCYLILESILDIRSRRISLGAAAGYLSIILILAVRGCIAMEGKAWSLLAGILAAAGSLLTHGSIGMGDAITIFTLGAAYPPGSMMTILTSAAFFCGAFSAIALACRKKNKEDSLPFIPFLLAGTIYAGIIK